MTFTDYRVHHHEALFGWVLSNCNEPEMEKVEKAMIAAILAALNRRGVMIPESKDEEKEAVKMALAGYQVA